MMLKKEVTNHDSLEVVIPYLVHFISIRFHFHFSLPCEMYLAIVNALVVVFQTLLNA